ncbi:MAG: translation initiation factor [Sphingobacteriia bacterium]|nr:MAG: translation initiation factor [Sphingobacteriia bacterium]TAG31507.1 MAG: translation initiation factor [Sphingobacteriia bacterium]TAH05993.1 MAG: translation initiation factor [Sphingobacteriia bacterium]
MNKKKLSGSTSIVYSTDPLFKSESEESEPLNTLIAAEQRLLILVDHKHRGGKTVTLVTGFIGQKTDLENLSKNLRNYCGTGGSAKDNTAIIQGDQRDKVLQWLLKNGYAKSKKK